MSLQRIAQIKHALNMQPHPEGGYYCERYRAASEIQSPVHNKLRSTLTHIYFLLTEGDISRWHKVVHDEIWNVYEGDPLRILTLNDNGIEDIIIGDTIVGNLTIGNINNDNISNDGINIDKNERSVNRDYYKLILGGDFQAAETTGLYTLLGCTVAPGFDFEDFSYIEDASVKDFVIAQGKDYHRFI